MTAQRSPGGIAAYIQISAPVADALAAGAPVVALESTLVTHGLPYPANLDVARAAEDAVRSEGAVPATVAVRDGRLLVGLEPADLEALATVRGARKASRPTLAVALLGGGWAGTTVSSTMIAAHAAGIAVFATGGIGGVHRGAFGGTTAPVSLDVSSDLDELARTPVAVVCAGPKAILDVPLTLEYLETRGVPVVAIGTDEMPGFYSRGSGIPAPASVPDEEAAAALVTTHRHLGLGSGPLLCVPVPAGDDLPLEVARAAIMRATREADEAGVHGPELTPWLLGRIADLTDGASVRANTALIVNDARVGARIAAALGRLATQETS